MTTADGIDRATTPDPRFDIVGWRVRLSPDDVFDFCTSHAPPRPFKGNQPVADRDPIRRDGDIRTVCLICDRPLP